MSKVCIYNATYDNVQEAIGRIFEDFPLPLKGKRVLVKPNMLGPFEHARGITTHPNVIRALVDKLESLGAAIIVGDNPGMRGYAANLSSAKASGIYEASKGHYINLSEEAISVAINSRFISEVVASKLLFEVDYYISVPKFKTHVQTMLTGAIKNSFGLLVGGQKSELHRIAPRARDFAELVVDVYSIRKPDLVIMDAIVGMEGNGPSSTKLRTIGKIMASDNGLEMDAAMALMMGAEPRSIDLLDIAHSRGLGEIDRENLDIFGPFEAIGDFKLPLGLARGELGTFLARLLTYVMVKQPVVKRELCTKCALCMKHCPVDAIEMTPYPRINREKCIACFCCNEFCKDDAMQIAGSSKFMRRRMNY